VNIKPLASCQGIKGLVLRLEERPVSARGEHWKNMNLMMPLPVQLIFRLHAVLSYFRFDTASIQVQAGTHEEIVE
jgi:hypothetical protein